MNTIGIRTFCVFPLALRIIKFDIFLSPSFCGKKSFSVVCINVKKGRERRKVGEPIIPWKRGERERRGKELIGTNELPKVMKAPSPIKKTAGKRGKTFQ